MDFLKELYLGNIFPADNHVCRHPEYKKVTNECSRQYDALKKKLHGEQLEQLNELLNIHTHLLTIYEEEAFKIGFRLGARTMCACFCEGTDPL